MWLSEKAPLTGMLKYLPRVLPLPPHSEVQEEIPEISGGPTACLRSLDLGAVWWGPEMCVQGVLVKTRNRTHCSEVLEMPLSGNSIW